MNYKRNRCFKNDMMILNLVYVTAIILCQIKMYNEFSFKYITLHFFYMRFLYLNYK